MLDEDEFERRATSSRSARGHARNALDQLVWDWESSRWVSQASAPAAKVDAKSVEYEREQREREARIKASRPKDSWWTSHKHKGTDYRKAVDASTSTGWTSSAAQIPQKPASAETRHSTAEPAMTSSAWLSSTWAM